MSQSLKALQLALLLLGTWLFYLAVTHEPATPRIPAPSASPLLYIGLWVGAVAAVVAAYRLGRSGRKGGR
ncbi:MAG: hypothetical protein ACK40O_11565 [Allosphingosinicella sp.]